MVIPQAAYATQDEENKPQSSDDEDCGSDEVPASIDGTIECIGEGECKSFLIETNRTCIDNLFLFFIRFENSCTPKT